MKAKKSQKNMWLATKVCLLIGGLPWPSEGLPFISREPVELIKTNLEVTAIKYSLELKFRIQPKTGRIQVAHSELLRNLLHRCMPLIQLMHPLGPLHNQETLCAWGWSVKKNKKTQQIPALVELTFIAWSQRNLFVHSMGLTLCLPYSPVISLNWHELRR